MRAYLRLFLTFAYIGALTFGGGYTMLPMFQRELVQKKNWLTDAEMTDLFSVGQCLPGVIASNAAVFVGNKQKGIPGGIVSALGVAFPSVVFILIIAAFLQNFAEYPAVQSAFAGLRICVCILIINAVAKLWKHAVKDAPALVIFILAFVASVALPIPVALIVILAGSSGVGISKARKMRARKGGAK